MLDKTYDPKEIEARLYPEWERGGAFKAHPGGLGVKLRPLQGQQFLAAIEYRLGHLRPEIEVVYRSRVIEAVDGKVRGCKTALVQLCAEGHDRVVGAHVGFRYVDPGEEAGGRLADAGLCG